MDKLLLSAFSAMLGFMLSQSFNFINYIRRPRFGTDHFEDGVISTYMGDPPETPWEIQLGFYLKNCGRNPARNTRVYVSAVKAASKSSADLSTTSTEIYELRRPLDFIPPGENVRVELGTIKGDSCDLRLCLNSPLDEEESGMVEADTRGMVRFSATFYVSCDDKNSFQSFVLEFRPDLNEWAASLFEDYTVDYLDFLTRPKL
ncbi:hypothetical protein LQ953_05595 [Sphingomonas sp. IC-56]|uniref:hypothetical protein n=1 Tax=Sphingomonas sp. IC-56 TaxID=2898529 RepID=UPI001E47389E|nr:hypothetical protein [Sphingomonas sp. IC-56]MCD2323487.1 hypothetical protein [Sphingomonas sp. IC-56]